MIPGEIIIKDSDIICNEGRETIKVKVTNTGDRPIQVGSHYHFFEVNRMMSFDREKAFGMRLNIIASTAVRFEPGEEKEVELTTFAGGQLLFGHNNLVDGHVSPQNRATAMKKIEEGKFKNVKS